MISKQLSEFAPSVVFPPGETLVETLEAIGMTQVDLAQRTGLSTKHVSEIVNGKVPVSVDVALKLEKVLGVPSHIWMNLDQRYQEYLTRSEEKASLEEDWEKYFSWAKNFPLREMCKMKWLERCDDRIDRVQSLLHFFRIASLNQWPPKAIEWDQAAFRQSKVQGDANATIAWLWKGILDAQYRDCAEFNATLFRNVLSTIRSLVIYPSEAVPCMSELCSRAGVALVFVHELPKISVYGATQWIKPDKAMIQMCLRGKRDDQFWFTFFHEAAHVLLHGKSERFIESDSDVMDERESQANKWATDFLIPPKDWQRISEDPFWMYTPRHYSSVASYNEKLKHLLSTFAEEIGMTPGVVVGRLQKEGLLRWDQCNDLKSKITWATDL